MDFKLHLQVMILILDPGAAFSKDITSTLQMPNAKYDTTESRMVSEMMILRSSLDTWLRRYQTKTLILT